MILNSLYNRVVLPGRWRQIEYFKSHAEEVQERTLTRLIQQAAYTEWGKSHDYPHIRSVVDFQQKVPLQSYADVKPYIERMRSGSENVLWSGPIRWFAQSSGTTHEKSKFLPVSHEALSHCHFQGPRDVLLCYTHTYPKSKIFCGKTLTLGGSHRIDQLSDQTRSGDLSAIMIDNAPWGSQFFRTPPKSVALLSQWEEKLSGIAKIVLKQHITALAGVPSWNLVLLKYLLAESGKSNLLELWPHLELFMHGGVGFGPYRKQFENLIPSSDMHYQETYNASEGFFAIQDDFKTHDMLLMLDYGVFYEFIPLSELDHPSFTPLTLGEVKTDVDYALVISTNSGLWRYLIGDTVRFTSTSPYKIVISGRTQYFINAFGEEVVLSNAEKAILAACQETGALVKEYTAGPVYMDADTNGAHEWIIEFEKAPSSLEQFTTVLDRSLQSMNSDYEAKRAGDITLRRPIVHAAPSGTFFNWMKQREKLGGQNKVPRLANHRQHLDEILKLLP